MSMIGAITGLVVYISPANGTIASCVAKLSGPGDECRLTSGTYTADETVVVPHLKGTAARPIVIAAAHGQHVRIDGTLPITATWTQQKVARNSSSSVAVAAGVIWEATLDAAQIPPAQLWLNDEMMTPARWPNALWSDRSIFNWTNLSAFDTSKPWSPDTYKPHTTKPLTFYTAPNLPFPPHVSMKGAMFVGNVAHMDTYAGKVVAHTAGASAFDVVIDVDEFGNSKASKSIFFIEGLASLIDLPTEWSYDAPSRKLSVMTPDGLAPNAKGRVVRGKAQTYAFNITDASYLTIANITFFGTTINARGDIPNMRWESLDFQYPSFSKRMLGSDRTASPTTLVATGGVAPPAPGPGPTPSPGPAPSASCAKIEAKDCPGLRGKGAKCEDCVEQHNKDFVVAGCYAKHARHLFIEQWCDESSSSSILSSAAPSAAESSLTVFNCSFYGADGLTFEHGGTASTFRNNYFGWNDWSTHDRNEHTGLGAHLLSAANGGGDPGSVYCGGYDTFERNSMIGNGPGLGYVAGDHSTLRLNRCDQQACLTNDGACIQIRSGSAIATTSQQNWATHSAKGFRLDSGSNTAFCPDEVNNTIERNVAFRTNGFELKNDYNTYNQNLALFPPPFTLHGSSATQVWRVDTDRFKGENENSHQSGNIANSWTTPIAGILNSSAPNVFAANVDAQLRDPLNWDFRPKENSGVAKVGAGPYDYAETKAGGCFAGGARYWIPGRQLYKASVPVPRNGTQTATHDADLMWLNELNGDYSPHHIFLANSRAALRAQTTPFATLPSGCNVQAITVAVALGDNGSNTWWWRVDTSDGVKGDEWTFTMKSSSR